MRKDKTFLRAFLLVLLISVFTAVYVSAEENENSITVSLAVENHTKGIEGAEFSAVKVMNLVDGTYILCEGMENTGITEEEVLDDPQKTAKLLAGMLTEGTVSQATDEEGTAIFAGLSEGIYLIWQTGSRGAAEDYQTAAPCLVNVPLWEENEQILDVVIYPKTAVRETQPAETTAADGSDETTAPEDADSKETTEAEGENSKETTVSGAEETTAAVGTGTSGNKNDGANTADNKNRLPYVMAMFVSAAGLLIIGILRKERSHEH